MVSFDPTIPAMEPQVTPFRAPHEYPGSQAGKYFLGGIGTAIGEGAKALDTVMKSLIQGEVHRQADPLQDALTRQLEETRNIQEGKKVRTANLQQPTDPIHQLQSDALPETVTQGINSARSLQDAREYGKIPYTYYLGRLNELAKNLRAQWPGYREEIDNEFHKITGHPIGNAYMLSLIQDIQHGGEGKDKYRDQVVSHMITAAAQGDKTASDLVPLVASDAIPWPFALSQWASHNKDLDDAKHAEAQFKTMHANDEMYDSKASKFLNAQFMPMMTELWHRPFLQFGGDKLSMLDVEERIRAGTFDVGMLKTEQATTQITQALGVMKRDMMKAAQTFEDADGNKLWSRNNDLVMKAINMNMKLAEEFVKDLGDPKSLGSMAHYFAEKAEWLQKDDMAKAMFGEMGKEFETMLRMQQLLRASGGDAAVQWFHTQHMTENQTSLNTAMRYMQEKAFFQPNRDQGMWETLEDQISQMKRVHPIDPTTGEPINIDAYRKFVDSVEMLRLTKDPRYVENMGHYLYDRKNNNVLDNFKRDDIDVRTGKPIDSQFSVFNQLTSADINKKIARAPQEVRDMQRNWTETEFMHLFAGKIQDMSKMQDYPGVKWNFDPDTHEIKFHMDWSEIPARQRQEVRLLDIEPKMKKIEKELNIGLRGLADVEDHNGRNANEYILDMFKALKYKTEGGPAIDARSGASKLLDQILYGIYSITGGDPADTAGRRLRQPAPKEEDKTK